jgi:hypothetical protein
MKFKRKNSKNKVTLTFSEDLTLPYAEEMKALFLETVGNGKNVTVAFQSVTDIDLSMLQLLCAAHRTAMRMNTAFTMDGEISDLCKTVIEDAGFVRHSGCRNNKNKADCLWLGGDA